MDRNHNRVTSVEQFRDELQGLLQRARKNLERDDGLANVVLLNGREMCRQLMIVGSVPGEIANRHLKCEVRQGNYEFVIFIGLAVTGPGGGADSEMIYRATSSIDDIGPMEKATLCIVVEGSHRDFGCHAAHWEFRRNGERVFSFGMKQAGPLAGGIVADLWPKRRLNA